MIIAEQVFYEQENGLKNKRVETKEKISHNPLFLLFVRLCRLSKTMTTIILNYRYILMFKKAEIQKCMTGRCIRYCL